MLITAEYRCNHDIKNHKTGEIILKANTSQAKKVIIPLNNIRALVSTGTKSDGWLEIRTLNIGEKEISADYKYDGNGNMIYDGRQEINLNYNFLNLISSNYKTGSNEKSEYIWSSDGRKLRVKNGNHGYEYLGSLIYSRNGNSLSLESAPFGGGRIAVTSSGQDIRTFITDHLGSVRAIRNGAGRIERVSDYYPFGMRWIGGEATTNRWQFNGKESQEMAGVDYLDYGARMYDKFSGRWGSVDKLTELYYSNSPYNLSLNNPINAIDPDGRLVIFINGFHGGNGARENYYWSSFPRNVMQHLNDYNSFFIDGSYGGLPLLMYNLSSKNRQKIGYEAGKVNARIIMDMISQNGNINETIKIITHSMGAAMGKGFVMTLLEYIEANNMDPKLIEFVADFAPYQPKKQSAVEGVVTMQFSHKTDKVAGSKSISGAFYMNTNASATKGGLESHSISSFAQYIMGLPEGEYKIENGRIVPSR